MKIRNENLKNNLIKFGAKVEFYKTFKYTFIRFH